MNKKYLVTTFVSLMLLAANTVPCSASEEAASMIQTETSGKAMPAILQSAIPVDETGVLSYIPNSAIEESQMQSLLFFQDQLLSYSSVYDADTGSDMLYLRLFSLDSGELLYETTLQTPASYAVVIQVCENRIAVNDAQSGIIRIFDETLQEIESFPASGDTIYVNPSLTKAYCLTGSGLHILDLETQEEQLLLEQAGDLSMYSYSGTDLSIRYVDLSSPDKKECYAGLDLETGTIEPFAIDDIFTGLEYRSGLWAGELLTEDHLYFFGSQQSPYKFHLDLSYPILRMVGDPVKLLFVTTDPNGTQGMHLYTADGAFLSSCSLDTIRGTMTTQQAWLPENEGCFFIVIDETGHDHLYFWDLSKSADGEDLTLLSYYEEEASGGEVLEQSYYDRARTLSEAYGVTIKIADQCSVDYEDKTAVLECDPAQVQTGLDVVERALAKYPDGFFRQLYYGSYRKMEFHLVGQIANKEEADIPVPAAFVQHINGKIIMVLNINEPADSLERTFYHESSHIIDQVLYHDAYYRNDALYSEETWWSLNPEEFRSLNPDYGGYYESYEMMPMDYYQELFTSYFAEDYGKSFSTEDRATIFEAAMCQTNQIFALDTPLYSKLKYYCDCIRDCFDTTGWPEYTTWEMALPK